MIIITVINILKGRKKKKQNKTKAKNIVENL